MMNNRMLSTLAKFDGDAEKWDDWEFNFVMIFASENPNFYKLFQFLRDRDHSGEVSDQDIKGLGSEEVIDEEELMWMCEALFMALSARTVSTPLSVAKGLGDDPGHGRGARAWKRIYS